MSGEHLSTAVVHDHAEGLLDARAAAGAERHLAECPACAAEVEAVRALRADAAGLPRSVEPGADLRTAIRAERDRRAGHPAGGAGRPAAAPGRARRPRRGTRAAAAAVVVVGVPSLLALGWWLGGGPGTAGGPASGMAGGAAPPAETVLTLDREYGRAAEELTASVTAGRDALSPEAFRLVRSNLDAVERALAESREALLEDPASAVLRELVLSAHRQRLDVLRQAAALASEGGGRS